MKICVITTVAQHYKGLDFHLRNLEWALKEYEYKIIIQTFKNFNFNIKNKKVKIIQVESDPKKFYYFWNKTSEIIKKEIEKTDCFLFTEQDIFFTKKIKFDKEKIQINLHSEYLSIYDNKKKFLYPRIWEGCTLISKFFLEQAIEDNIKFGNSKKIPNWLIFEDLFTSNSSLNQDFRTIKKQIEDSNFLNKECVDTLFELTLYCFYKNFPFELNTNNKSYDYGEQVVHFRALDGFVRANQNIYASPEEILKLQKSQINHKAWKRLGGGCAFVFFIIGLYKKTKILRQLIINDDYLLKEKILKLKEFSNQWMLDYEIKNLDWCVSLFEKNKMFL